mmetsp:Transcript_61340/g.170072  ORF Transcript_61340/g.170072 Transcript_61340/m.170072 type:complete len:90 (+) Transcript_61340:1087-1356(+)
MGATASKHLAEDAATAEEPQPVGRLLLRHLQQPPRGVLVDSPCCLGLEHKREPCGATAKQEGTDTFDSSVGSVPESHGKYKAGPFNMIP